MQGVKGWERQIRVSGPKKTAPVLGNLLKGLGLQCKLGHGDQGKPRPNELLLDTGSHNLSPGTG